MKNKKMLYIIFCIMLAFLIIIMFALFGKHSNEGELLHIKSIGQLEAIYQGKNENKNCEILYTIPWSVFSMFTYPIGIAYEQEISIDSAVNKAESSTNTLSTKEYSTTNVQVENVDEADVLKTDGDYIYSISGTDVVITNVNDPEKPKIEAKISSSDSYSVPEELVLYENKLVIIYAQTQNRSYNNNTEVLIFDISNKEKPNKEKSYVLNEPYYTSRCINGKLYVMSSGTLRKEDDEIDISYKENNTTKQIPLESISYIKGLDISRIQTLIAITDLNDIKKDIKVNSYLMNISNCYVSENAIYMLNSKYDNNKDIPILKLFGLKGVFGIKDELNKIGEYTSYTNIYKFEFKDNGELKFSAKTKTEGNTINQFSVDEYDNSLRVAVYNNKGSRVVIFDSNLNEIGKTDYLAKGERMYSSRFIGNKAYLVTYKTVDPLYVIDLQNKQKPEVLGELKIPGYSTYLHPYDESHIIGIGMETEEIINRDKSGKVINTTAKVVGMKMALFDVSDVNNPIQISSTVIGDSKTSSAILTNHKAILFSKEKELLAIPVNNYVEEFKVNSSENYNTLINNYTNYRKDLVSEGYLVYKVNTDDGINLRGTINHRKTNINNYNSTKLLRGLYINNNLFTISEEFLKVNNLENLEQISEMKIKEEK